MNPPDWKSWLDVDADGEGIRLGGWIPTAGDGPPGVFLHGTGLCTATYQPFLQELSGSFSLFTLDLPGHGCSSGRFPGFAETTALVGRVLERRRQAGNGAPLVGIGHSAGAVILLKLAARRPDLFSRLILLDPVLFPRPWLAVQALTQVLPPRARSPFTWRAWHRRDGFADRDDARRFFHGRGMFASWSPAAFEAFIRYGLREEGGDLRLDCHPHNETLMFGGSMGRLWLDVADLRLPVRAWYGQETYPWLPWCLNAAGRSNPLFTPQEINGSHFFMFENPVEAARQISGDGN